MYTTATFRLFGGPGLTASFVSDQLSIAPSRSFEEGDPVSPRSHGLRATSGWLLASSAGIESGVELETQLERLFEILEPVESELWSLDRAGYQTSWHCYIASNPAEHAAELSRDALTRLLALPGALLLDACGDGGLSTGP